MRKTLIFLSVPSLRGRIAPVSSLQLVVLTGPVPAGTDSSQTKTLTHWQSGSRPCGDG